MIIGACGFGSTGSSAVSDFLLEYGNVQVLDKVEFTWVSGVDGLIDLDFHVNHPHNRTTDSIIAIERYRKKFEGSIRYYSKIGGMNPEHFKQSLESFLSTITTVKWHWAFGEPRDLFDKYIGRRLLANRLYPRIERKTGKLVNKYPLKEVSLSVMPKDFDAAATKHVRELLSILGATFDKPLVLDQPFSGNNPQACFKFFDDPYAIVVDRDPRDNYTFARTKLLGVNHNMAVGSVEDFVKYYRALRDGQPYKDKHDRVLSIKFEDMVYRYDETTALIRNFLHLPENPHPKSIFDPAISMPNTQVWKRFPQFARDIEYIEKELPEYLFDYTGFPEPDRTAKMFYGKSPKNKG